MYLYTAKEKQNGSKFLQSAPSYLANKRTLEARLNAWNRTRQSDGKDCFQYRKDGH